MNNEIKPHYVDFNISKLLKEKGFEDIQIDYGLNQMLNNCKPPEQWQVCEWLRINHDIHVTYDIGLTGYYALIKYRHTKSSLYLSKWVNEQSNPFNSPQEAYSAAINYVLENLI
jgi:hypothetical protein